MFPARTPALITFTFVLAAGLGWARPAAAESATAGPATAAPPPAPALHASTQGAAAAGPAVGVTRAGQEEVVVAYAVDGKPDGAVAGRTGVDHYASVLSVDDTGLRVERAPIATDQADAGCACPGDAVSGRIERGKTVPRQKKVKGKTKPST